MILVNINLFEKIFVKFLPKKVVTKTTSIQAALLHSPLDGLHGPHGLVCMQYSEIFRKKKNSLLQRNRKYLFVSNSCCLLRLTKHRVPWDKTQIVPQFKLCQNSLWYTTQDVSKLKLRQLIF